MPTDINTVKSSTNINIRQKVQKDSITPEVLADQLDILTDFSKDYADGMVDIPVALPSTNPAEEKPNAQVWRASGVGEYTYFLDIGGNPIVVITADVENANTAFLVWKGSYWDKEVKIMAVSTAVKLDPIDTTKIQTGKSVSDWTKEFIDGDSEDLDANTSECITGPTVSGTKNIIFNFPIPVGSRIVEVEIYATTPGNINIGNYQKSDNTIKLNSNKLVTLVAGLNTFTFTVSEGNYFGINCNTGSLPGRVGTKVETAEYEHWDISGSVGGSYVSLPAISSARRWGVKLKLHSDISVQSQIDNDLVNKNTIEYIADSDGANKFTDGTIVNDFLVNSSGALQAVAGWKYWEIVLDNTKDAIGVMGLQARPASVVYWRFEDSSGGMISFGTYTANQNMGLRIPAGAVKFQIDIKANTDTDSVYTNTLITYDMIITELNNAKLLGSGGNSFDQSLNTTDGVKFAGLEVDALKINGLPTTEGEAEIGGIWIDTVNGNVLKVRLA